jgi:hypothetical protein
MNASLLNDFRLVGGTSLSLQLGHRLSVDIDLFTDASYGSVNFEQIDQFLKNTFRYNRNTHDSTNAALGKCYIIGDYENETVKLDIFYTDTFIKPPLLIDNMRMASIEEIAAMKIDVIQRIGRKKDFWDIHEMLNHLSVKQMLALHEERYEYNHDKSLIIRNFTNFVLADNEFDPVCLRGKYWEIIKDDLTDEIGAYL